MEGRETMARSKRKLRLTPRLTLAAALFATAAVLCVPSVAAAASGTLSVTGPDPSVGIDVSATIVVTPADCASYGYCGWFVVLTAAPANQSCATYQSSQLVGVGPLEQTTETASQPFDALLFGQGPFDLCLFIYPPTAPGTNQLLAQTSYDPPSPTGTISSELQVNGAIGGTITVTQPYCSGCFWEATATVEDGGAACPGSPASAPVWSGPFEAASGTYSWPYSFTPDISTGTVSVCVYVEQQLVGSGTFTFPPPATPPPSGTQGRRLTLTAAKNALRQALRRKFRNAHSFTLTCTRVTATKVRCQVRFVRAGRRWAGIAVAHLSGNFIYMSAKVGPIQPTTPPPSRPAPPTPTPTPTGCYPLSNSGTCYEPGEYCRNDDHGASGVAGDGEAITCEDNDGWRWEPS